MTTLALRINKYIDSDGGAPPEVPARIYAIDPQSGSNRSSTLARRELVPISNQAGQVRSISLDPGIYFVEVSLPSGEVLNDQVVVPATGQAELVLQATDSPHEWLSWQHLLGNVSSVVPTSPVEPALAIRRPVAGRSRVKHAAAKKKAVKRFAAKKAQATPGRGTSGKKLYAMRDTTGRFKDITAYSRASAAARAAIAPLVDIRPEIYCLTAPLLPLIGHGDVWQALAALHGSSEELLQQLNSAQSPYPIPMHVRDPGRAVYRVTRGAANVSSATTLNSALPRDFLVVPQHGRLELISLPTPWMQIRTGREAIIEIVVQQTALPNEFVSSIGVRDEQLAVLLGFLSTGALGAVQEIAESAKELLYGKTQNYLAAAAGAYAMVSNATDSSSREWHQWVRNLAQWFPLMPDGAIQLAQLLLRIRRSPADLTEATALLKQAYLRGLPYYTLGVRWLLDGLEKVGRLDPEAATMCKAVQQIANRIHPQSPFTILRPGNH